MAAFAVFVLSVYGLANAIAVLKAGKWIRTALESLAEGVRPRLFALPFIFLSALFRCPPCLSFWIGVAASRWALSPSVDAVLARGGNAWTAAVLDGLAACAVGWILHVAAMRMCFGIEKLIEIEKVKEI